MHAVKGTPDAWTRPRSRQIEIAGAFSNAVPVRMTEDIFTEPGMQWEGDAYM